MTDAATAAADSILTGLRVLDLAGGLAGSVAAWQLSQAGAAVWKVTSPGGSVDSSFSPDLPPWSVCNRGKQRVAIDLRAATGRAELDALLARADVLIHDFTPGEAQQRGLGDAQLSARYPQLVISAIGGWPQRHAWADAPVDETLVLAQLGVLDEQPGHRPGPVFIRMPFASWIAAWLCAVGVLARLLARDRDGHGGAAHTSLAQAALVPMAMHWARAERPTPAFAKGLDKNTPIPLHQCADGRWIHVHYSPDAAPWMAQGLAALGPDGVARANALYPPSHVAPNFGANREIIATRDADAWAAHFWAHDVAAQVAAPFGAIYRDAQAQANGYVVSIDDPRLGPTLQPGVPFHVSPASKVQGLVRRPVGEVDSVAEAVAARTSATPSTSALPPLHGLKVLDLGAYLAGPFACMVLADLGADVIKVEPPTGDAMRRLERTFAGAQRGKRGLALKLGAAATQPVLDALADWADVVHHNVRLPAARKLGIDAQQLRAGRPALICCHISSYGPAGARADWPGFDQLMQASCGWEVESGGAGQPPMWLRFGVGDHLAALASVFAVLLALYRRGRTGEGQSVAASLLGAMLLTQSEAVGLADASVTPIAQLDAAQTGVSATHRLYPCADGWIAVSARSDAQVQAFHALAGATPETFFAALTVDAALALLTDAHVPAAPALQQQTLPFLDHPAHAAAGLHAHYRHAVYGDLQQVGAFWNFNDLPLALSRPPPALGEHSAELLALLGFDANAVEQLQLAGLTKPAAAPSVGAANPVSKITLELMLVRNSTP